MEENDTLSKPRQQFAALNEKEIKAKRAHGELEESWWCNVSPQLWTGIYCSQTAPLTLG